MGSDLTRTTSSSNLDGDRTLAHSVGRPKSTSVDEAVTFAPLPDNRRQRRQTRFSFPMSRNSDRRVFLTGQLGPCPRPLSPLSGRPRHTKEKKIAKNAARPEKMGNGTQKNSVEDESGDDIAPRQPLHKTVQQFMRKTSNCVNLHPLQTQ